MEVITDIDVGHSRLGLFVCTHCEHGWMCPLRSPMHSSLYVALPGHITRLVPPLPTSLNVACSMVKEHFHSYHFYLPSKTSQSGLRLCWEGEQRSSRPHLWPWTPQPRRRESKVYNQMHAEVCSLKVKGTNREEPWSALMQNIYPTPKERKKRLKLKPS